MRSVLQWTGWVIGIPLEILIIAALVRGPFRRYPFVFTYSIVLFLTTVIEVSAFQSSRAGIRFSWARYYWIDDGLRQALVFAVVISLIYLASDALQSRTLIRTGLICGAAIFAGISLLIHYDNHEPTGQWMTLLSRDLDFTAALLDVALWLMLLSARHKNTQLLLLSGGLGIQFAGEAIGQSLRTLLPAYLSPGDIVILLASLTGMWIWWRALRASPAPKPAPQVARSAKNQGSRGPE